jgi:hypothetical protein
MKDDAKSAPADLAAVDVEAARDLEDRLPLVVTVGFTGHRSVPDLPVAQRVLEQALEVVGEAFDLLLKDKYLAEAYDGTPRLRLMIGEAPGADRLAASIWRADAMGEVHAIYPFKDPAGEAAWTDRPEKDDTETRVFPLPEFGPWTGIDSAGLGLTSQQAHAEVGRWIVRHCDLLIGWWDGEPSRGAGGTHDTMEHALDRGMPVIWLQPGEAELRLIDPHISRRRHGDASEAMMGLGEIAGSLTAERLAALLHPSFAPPGLPHTHDPEVRARVDYADVDPLRIRRPPAGWVQALFNHTLWRSFRLFEHVVGGARLAAGGASPSPPPGLIDQPGFLRLRAASSEAGARANSLSAIHRSEQLLLIVLAILAVFFGALPALLTATSDSSDALHAASSAVEFGLGGLAIIIAFTARRAHRHRRWSDSRRLAERLRGASATWTIGLDVADQHLDPPQTWTEWRARAVLRAAGPRRGWLTKERFERTAAWCVSQLIDGQIAYHERQHRVAERIEGRIRLAENWSFGVLMVMLALFVGAYFSEKMFHIPPPPAWVAGLVTLVSAVSPAVGAGCLALDATNGFGEIALHSARLKLEFEHRRDQLAKGGGDEYHHVQAVIRSAAQLLRDENDAWRDSLLRRRIVRT